LRAYRIMPLRVGIDVGGTFTDLVAIDDESGAIVRVKVPSVPAAPEVGVLAAFDALLARTDANAIASVSHSTTVATNALLGQMNLELPRLALLVTEGFRDVIEIGRQNRSEVYNLFVSRPPPLVARADRIPVRERMDFRGQAIVPLEPAAIEAAIDALRARPGVASIAVAFLHSYANDAHERAVGDALRAAFPGLDVTLSSEVDPAYREYERTSTTVVNAALLPLVRGYLERLTTALRQRGVRAALYVMQSGGGMASADAAADRPATIIESGPASGVIGAAALARTLRIERALSFDMGGTTAKAGTILGGVAQVVGEFEAAGRSHSGRAVRGSGYPVRFPFVDLAEVSAGGGTIAFVDDAGALRVGPLSAGADPGPAAYGTGARPTVTDANIVLGRLNPHALLGGAMPIDAACARAAIASLVPAMRGLTLDETAAGIIALIDDAMGKVLRIVTIERGHDPRDFTLIAFGGGGPLHACALAAELGIARVIVPAAPGLFSAHGLLAADLTVTGVRGIVADGDPSAADIEQLFGREEERGRAALRAQGVADAAMRSAREIDARYAGQSFELTLPAGTPFDRAARATLVAAFHDRHERIYGFASRDERVELVNVRSSAIGDLPKPADARPPRAPDARPLRGDPALRALLERRSVYHGEAGRLDTPVFDRARLLPGDRLNGPAIVEQYDACTLVPPSWWARVDSGERLVMERT
jgi:N-methylhydantoinase A